MGYAFERPVGAFADAMELEYIAALHQVNDADDEGWLDASIEVADIKSFLLSRYGIVVSKKDIRQLIYKGLAGGHADDECIDLVEVLAILLIPYFSKLVQEEDARRKRDSMNYFIHRESIKLLDIEEECKKMQIDGDNVISDVLRIILTESVGSSEPPLLTKDLLRTIFSRYDELALIENEDLLDEMIYVATGGKRNAVLDEETFARALTNDVMKYNPEWESRVSTHYEDAFGFDLEINTMNFNGSFVERKRKVKRIFTFPQIDCMADTFRSKLHFTCALCAFIISYVSYCSGNHPKLSIPCDEDILICQIGRTIVTWFVIMLNVMGVGLVMLLLLNLGNMPNSDLKQTPLLEIIAGLLSTIVLTLVPAFVEFNFGIFNTMNDEGDDGIISKLQKFILVLLGTILILLQISNTVYTLVSKERKYLMRWLQAFRGIDAKREFHIKQAASFKINQLVYNAYLLHSAKKELEMEPDTTTALLKYTNEGEKKERIGGFLWCWKQFLSGKIMYREGVWIHTRMIAVNIAQILVTFFTAAFVLILIEDVVKALHPDLQFQANFTEFKTNSTECMSQFNASSCTYPRFGKKYAGFASCQVSYSDGCKFESVPNDLYKLFCSYFDHSNNEAGEFGSDFDFSSIYSCPELVYPSHPTNSLSSDGATNGTCRAALTACALNPLRKNLGSCLVGINTRNTGPALYDFSGLGCFANENINNLINDGAIFKEVEKSLQVTTIPQKWVIRMSGFIGVSAATMVGMTNALTNIPSIIITTLKFRSGVLPSLRSSKFKKYRMNMLDSTLLIGASIWGTITMSFFVFIFISIPVFLFTYQQTAPYMIKFLSFMIGVIITVAIKAILQFTFALNFEAFYRKRPLLCNVVNVAFECWNLSLTASFILVRSLKLLFATCVFLGRFDKPLLSEDVEMIGSIYLDKYPLIFRKDLLATDSHRHPYIERLGFMYMMKLRHGENFGKQSGSTWRLLFIFALMPWLRKYRIKSESAHRDDNGKTLKGSQMKSRAQLEEQIRVLKLNLAQKIRERQMHMNRHELV